MNERYSHIGSRTNNLFFQLVNDGKLVGPQRQLRWFLIKTRFLRKFAAERVTLTCELSMLKVLKKSARILFFPLFLFHAVVAKKKFYLPAPSVPHGRNWAPFHAIVATPLLIAFELLLFIFLESSYEEKVPVVSLKIVFLPLLAFEVTILIDNFRMCKALLPGEEESLSDDAIWETLPVSLHTPNVSFLYYFKS